MPRKAKIENTAQPAIEIASTAPESAMSETPKKPLRKRATSSKTKDEAATETANLITLEPPPAELPLVDSPPSAETSSKKTTTRAKSTRTSAKASKATTTDTSASTPPVEETDSAPPRVSDEVSPPAPVMRHEPIAQPTMTAKTEEKAEAESIQAPLSEVAPLPDTNAPSAITAPTPNWRERHYRDSNGNGNGNGNGRPDRGERNDRPNRPERGDRLERNDRPNRPERGDRLERNDRPNRPERGDRLERNDRPNRPERGDRLERNDRPNRPERGDRLERIDRPERMERLDRPERLDMPERVDRMDKGETPDGFEREMPLAPRPRKFFDMVALDNETLPELRARAEAMGVQSYTRLKKDDLIVALLRAQAEKQGLEYRGGVLDVIDDNLGFLRAEHYLPGPEDIYVSPSQIRRFGLRTGDMVFGQVRAPKESEKYYSLLRVESVNGQDPEQAKGRPHFEKLTPIFPNKLFDLESGSTNLSTRLINLISPIGRGQRGLIVAPPKVGKTTILKDIANAISRNYRDVHLMIALIAERPEEATDMDRSVDGEVVSSTFDEPVQSHVRVAEMVLARAKRLVECGRDVVILLDSLTRLSRAYNLTVNSSGRTLSGGIDPAAMYPPKEFFGAARNIEEGGSLTIIATVLVDTNSRMDEVIFEEFKGTGNMELHLSRKMADRRVFPAIDIDRSSTRREDLLLGEKTAQRTYLMRRMFGQLIAPQPQGAGYELTQAMEAFLNRFNRTKSNDEFLQSLVS